MSVVQQARAALAKWRTASDRLRPAPWSPAPLWGGMLITDADGAQLNSDDQADAAEFNGPVAALIAGTAGNPELWDSIDGLLRHHEEDGMTVSAVASWVRNIATAIVRADERMDA